MKLRTPAYGLVLLLGGAILAPSHQAAAHMVYSPIWVLGSGLRTLNHPGDGRQAWFSVGTSAERRANPGTTNVGLNWTIICIGNETCDDSYLQAFNECSDGNYTWAPITFAPNTSVVVRAPTCTSWNYSPINAGFVAIGE